MKITNIYLKWINMKTKKNLLLENKEIFWDIKDISKLDDYAIEERFLKYWNLQNIQDMIEIFWWEKVRENYIYLKNKKRSDFSKRTINFFNLYLNV